MKVSDRKLGSGTLFDDRYGDTLDGFHEAVAIDDSDGYLIYVNRRFSELFECQPSSLADARLEHFVAPEWTSTLEARRQGRARGEDEPAAYELEGRTTSGRRVWLEVIALALYEDGAQVGTQVVVRDVTTRTRAERPRSDAPRALHDFVRALPLAAYVVDRHGIVSDANAASETVLGWPAERIIGCRCPLADGVALPAALEDARTRGGLETLATTLGGRTVAVELHAMPFLDDHGEHAGYLAILVDNRARKAAEHDYETIFQHAMDAIIIFDVEDETVLEANPRACEIHGVTRDELVGTSLERFTKDVPRGRAAIARTLERGKMAAFDTVHVRKDGTEVHLSAAAVVVEYQGRRAIMSIARDVTERARLEGAVNRAQKMEALAMLAAGVAHDFNNLLVGILSSAELLQESRAITPDDMELVREIVHAGDRARALTQQLLAFGRQQRIDPISVSAERLVADVAPLIRRVAGPHVAVKVSTSAGGYTHVLVDPRQIERALLNLAVNGRDAMPEGGTLTLSTREVKDANELASFGIAATDTPHLEIAVCDDGVGMNEQIQSKLFTPFFTTKGPGKGTGLGLAGVHGIVMQAGGHLHIESAPGRGTTVRIFLPRTSVVPDSWSSAPPSSHGNETILVVDDEPKELRSTERLLRAAGYRVIATADAASAIQALERGELAAVDLLLTSVVMPGRTGPELATYLVGAKTDMKVLFMSEAPRDQVAATGLAQFIAKPFKASTLARAVRRALDGIPRPPG